MSELLLVGDFNIEVVKKNIKNIHLSVHPPKGVVKVSAPINVDTEIIRIFALSKLDWIKRNNKKIINQQRETKRELIDRESVFIWGKRYLIKIENYTDGNRIEIKGKHLVIKINKSDNFKTKENIIEKWYRIELRKKAEKLIDHWHFKLKVNIPKLYIERMKTKWGSCSLNTQSIRLNTELVHKNLEALEFVVVHELIHFIEKKHNNRFYILLEKALPKWKIIRQKLNELPLSYSTWSKVIKKNSHKC